MVKIYEKYSKQFPEYKSYLHHNTSMGCVNQLKPKHGGKQLLGFASKVIKQGGWQKDPKLKELARDALATLKVIKFGSLEKKKVVTLKNDFEVKLKKIKLHQPKPPVKPPGHPPHKPTLIQNKQINPAHYRQFSRPIEIPEGPKINLLEKYEELWSIWESTWPDSVEVQDDNFRQSKSRILEDLRCIFELLEYSHYAKLGEESNVLVRNGLRHILNYFDKRKNTCERMIEGQEKKKEYKKLQDDMRRFFQRLGVTFNHCSDRIVTGIIEYYSEFILKQPMNEEELKKRTLEQHLFNRLREYRQTLLQSAYINFIKTDLHDAATERYVKNQLNKEFGLGYPSAIGAKDNYNGLALKDKVNELKKQFLNLYTPQAVLKHLKHLVKSDELYMKIVNWFEKQTPRKTADKIYDVEKNEFKDTALVELLEKLHVIENKKPATPHKKIAHHS
jgi:hypothetical protein